MKPGDKIVTIDYDSVLAGVGIRTFVSTYKTAILASSPENASEIKQFFKEQCGVDLQESPMVSNERIRNTLGMEALILDDKQYPRVASMLSIIHIDSSDDPIEALAEAKVQLAKIALEKQGIEQKDGRSLS